MNTVYLDNAATTRVDSAVADAAVFAMREAYGNPSSLHAMGLRAEQLLTAAAERVRRLMGARGGRLVFTGSGTEASNIALLGAAAQRAGRGKHLIGTQTEHPAVLNTLRALEGRGFALTLLPPGRGGAVSPEALADACRADTVLVSAMAVNNETGALHDLPAMVAAVRQKSPHALFHTDAVQALGKIPLSVSAWGLDLVSVSGHKLYAPKGAGALWIAGNTPLAPILFGGGQQYGLRPGTEAVPFAHALGEAAALAEAHFAERAEHAAALRARLWGALAQAPWAHVLSPEIGSPYILNFSMPGYKAEPVLHFLEARGLYLSSGSACARGEPSHVLAAMGLPPADTDAALRVSFSHDNTPADIDALLAALADARAQLIAKR